MLVGHGGRERTRKEYSELLDRSGLRLASVRPAALYFSVIEAVAQPAPRAARGNSVKAP
jgi:hypothetical protein